MLRDIIKYKYLNMYINLIFKYIIKNGKFITNYIKKINSAFVENAVV